MTSNPSRSTGGTSSIPVLAKMIPTTTTKKMGLTMELLPLTRRKRTSNPCPRKRRIRHWQRLMDLILSCQRYLWRTRLRRTKRQSKQRLIVKRAKR